MLRLSRTRTRSPRPTSDVAMWDPMKPAPPVTRYIKPRSDAAAFRDDNIANQGPSLMGLAAKGNLVSAPMNAGGGE